jgi:hypothetical protein
MDWATSQGYVDMNIYIDEYFFQRHAVIHMNLLKIRAVYLCREVSVYDGQ